MIENAMFTQVAKYFFTQKVKSFDYHVDKISVEFSYLSCLIRINNLKKLSK